MRPRLAEFVSVSRRKIYGAFLAVTPLFEIVVEALILIERVHARCLHGSDVHKAIGRAIIGLDEAITLIGVEELDGSDFAHNVFLSRTMVSTRRHAARIVLRIVR